MLFNQITIIGVGLIGGSVGLASKRRGVARRVVGVGRDRAKLEEARQVGAIDEWTTDLAIGLRGSDLLVICIPVERIAQTILDAAEYADPGLLITDGGSTKQAIIAAVESRLTDVAYVGAHPLAGSERTGAIHADARLFENRVTVVTPNDTSDPIAVDRVEEFWSGLGSRIVRMSPVDHDNALATTSHMPHAVAAAVAIATPREWLDLTAGGFRDTTRIAAGDPALWAGIFETNRDAVLNAIDGFSARLDTFRRTLASGDSAGLVRWLTEAKQVRDALGTSDSAQGAG